MYRPSRDEFERMSRSGSSRILITREFSGDLETPVSLFSKLRGSGPAFLMECAEPSCTGGRTSILILGGTSSLAIDRGVATVVREGRRTERKLAPGSDLLGVLDELLSAQTCEASVGCAGFPGGAVGYLGYDVVRQFERLPAPRGVESGPPEAQFVVAEKVAVFDPIRHRITLGVFADAAGGSEGYARACAAIDELARKLDEGVRPPRGEARPATLAFDDHFPAGKFREAVDRAKRHIRAGDIFQVVLSRRRVARCRSSAFEIYRALRMINPSPYMFFFDFGDLQMVGASPESLVRLSDGVASIRPIAGTRPRAANHSERDHVLEQELLADPKEGAEHVMLVDLARNDLGRVCETGSVVVRDFRTVERFSHVMHLVSQVEGRLAPGRTPFDLVRATFPAGTVSGAPKIRAMQIIDDLEPVGRGPYGGAAGFFGFGGRLDLCLTIRMLWAWKGSVFLQAGAGIVADSDPDRELAETEAKLAALEEAVRMAEGGLP